MQFSGSRFKSALGKKKPAVLQLLFWKLPGFKLVGGGGGFFERAQCLFAQTAIGQIRSTILCSRRHSKY